MIFTAVPSSLNSEITLIDWNIINIIYMFPNTNDISKYRKVN